MFLTYILCNDYIQDFSNLLEGGLVSFSTMSSSTVQSLAGISAGGVIVLYKYSPSDVVPAPGDIGQSDESRDVSNHAGHTVHAICWRGKKRH